MSPPRRPHKGTHLRLLSVFWSLDWHQCSGPGSGTPRLIFLLGREHPQQLMSGHEHEPPHGSPIYIGPSQVATDCHQLDQQLNYSHHTANAPPDRSPPQHPVLHVLPPGEHHQALVLQHPAPFEVIRLPGRGEQAPVAWK